MRLPARPTTVLLAIALAACSPSASESASPSEPAEPSATSEASAEPFGLNVYAAASLTDAMEAIEGVYEADTPGADLTIATESSTTLRTQIEEGAPADVFLSADTSNPAALDEAGRCDAPPVDYAGNSLALVVPDTNEAGIETPANLADDGVQVIAALPDVPISGYVAEVVASLAELPDYLAGFAEAYAANVVSEEDNVRAVLNRLELNEGDAGFVYQTDALGSSEVTAIEIPAEANTHAVYAGCVISAAPSQTERSHAFFDWLVGADGQAILADFGFVAP
jgi:molybdate transport system substrate-binding protein